MTSKRPGRKEIPQATKDEIRRFSEVEGLSPPEIARQLVLDPRTVRKYVVAIARDRAMHEATVQVFRAAMEAHHRDLGSIAEGIKTSFVLPERLLQPISDPTGQISDMRLYSGFEQHMDRSSLWRHLASWNNAAARWQTLAHTYWESLSQKLVTSSGIAWADVPDGLGWLPGTKELIEEVAVQEVKGLSMVWPPADPYQQKERRSGHILISIGERDVLRLNSSDPKPELQALAKTWDTMRSSSEMVELTKKNGVWSNLQASQKGAYSELETMLLRRVFPGRCRFCPG